MYRLREAVMSRTNFNTFIYGSSAAKSGKFAGARRKERGLRRGNKCKVNLTGALLFVEIALFQILLECKTTLETMKKTADI